MVHVVRESVLSQDPKGLLEKRSPQFNYYALTKFVLLHFGHGGKVSELSSKTTTCPQLVH